MASRKRKSGEDLTARDVEDAVGAFVRLDPRAQLLIVAIVFVIGIAVGVWYWRQHHRPVATTPTPPPPAARTQTAPQTATPAAAGGISTGPANMLLGNPSGATADPANRDNYLMVKPYFSLSYNSSTGCPNWVSWRVTREDLAGKAARKQIFDPDDTLPAGFVRVVHKDYSGSGFDRGHMCPHADRDATEEMSFATFVMTNIIPQAPNVNEGTWADLEDYCRTLVRRDNDHLYVTSGPLGRGGRGSNGPRQTLANGKVTVPAECWKVVVVLPGTGAGPDDVAAVGDSTRVIAVLMPNDNDAIRPDWASYRVSVADLERRTGYHFFDRVRPEVAIRLRDKVDAVPVTPAPTRGRR